jgi:hypothetical protein
MSEINNNIEERLKIVLNKLKDDYDKKLGESIKHEKETLLKKLFDMFPYSNEDKDQIIKEFMKGEEEKKEEKKEKPVLPEIILEQFLYNNENYYFDKEGSIWDKNADIIGSYDGLTDDHIPKNIYLFNNMKKKNIKINFNLE